MSSSVSIRTQPKTPSNSVMTVFTAEFNRNEYPITPAVLANIILSYAFSENFDEGISVGDQYQKFSLKSESDFNFIRKLRGSFFNKKELLKELNTHSTRERMTAGINSDGNPMSENMASALRGIHSENIKLNREFVDLEVLWNAVANDPLVVAVTSGYSLSQVNASKNTAVQTSKKPVTTTSNSTSSFMKKLSADQSVISVGDLSSDLMETVQLRSKSNPIIIGHSGSGKMSTIKDMVNQIESGIGVPQTLKDTSVFELDLPLLLSKCNNRQEAEKCFSEIASHFESTSSNDILVIENIHLLMENQSALNAFKPLMASGLIQVISTTTPDKFRDIVSQDHVMSDHLAPVNIKKPAKDDLVAILRANKKTLEQHHQVKISDSALSAVADLTSRFMPSKTQPEVSMSVIDKACARFARDVSSLETRQTRKINNEISSVKKQISSIDSDDSVKDEQTTKTYNKLKEKLSDLEKLLKSASKPKSDTVDKAIVSDLVSEISGIPSQQLDADDSARLVSMASTIKSKLIGQDHAVEKVSEMVKRSRSGLGDNNKPIGSILVAGSSGSGKTELAKQLAQFLFNDKNAMVRLDMSEYMEKSSVNRLFGPPPGYVGYEEGGALTNAILEKPYSVLLLDEVEKAHPDVFQSLLGVFDEGRLTDGKGNLVDFKNTIIVMTSNLGARDLVDMYAQNKPQEEVDATVKKHITGHFSNEFINRLEEIVVFNPLNKDVLKLIGKNKMRELSEKLEKNTGSTVSVTDDLLDAMIESSFDASKGARPLERTIQKSLANKLSNEILSGSISPNSHITVSGTLDKMIFQSSPLDDSGSDLKDQPKLESGLKNRRAKPSDKSDSGLSLAKKKSPVTTG